MKQPILKWDLKVKITKSLKSWKGLIKHRDPKIFEKVSNHGKELLSCDKCEYQCKKENTLNKHRHKKHKPHACKVCGHKPPSMVDMLKHFANEHNKKMVQIRDIKEQNILNERQNHK